MPNICGNFAIEGECGTCEHCMIWGIRSGVCLAEGEKEMKDVMTEDKCDCGKYKKNEESFN